MSEHPLRQYVDRQRTTLADFAASVGLSRMTLHRIMRGENTTLDALRRISDATHGLVSVEAIVAASEQARVVDAVIDGAGSDHVDEDVAPHSSCHVNEAAMASREVVS